MGRLSTPLLHRGDPRAHPPPRHPARAIPHHQKQTASASSRAHVRSAARSPGARSRLHSTGTSRLLAARPRLAPIREEPEEEEGLGPPAGGARDARGSGAEAWVRGDAVSPGPARWKQREDEDVDMLNSSWDEETTLVAMLQDGTPEEDEEEQLMALVEQLRAPMAAQGSDLKKYLKDTILPAFQQIKETHNAIEDKVDIAFGAGILTFDEVCKKVERIALRDEDDLRTARAESQASMQKTLAELEVACGRRKELWTALEVDLERCASRASAALEGLSADVESTIARLDKKSKSLDKDSSSAANQKMLRTLLEKL